MQTPGAHRLQIRTQIMAIHTGFYMRTHILFIQGGGNGGYQADKALVNSFQQHLGDRYDIDYPEMPSDETAPDFGWLQAIGKKISEAGNNFILAGHSLGASMILKFLSENNVSQKIKGIFLIATPFWSGDEEWKQGLKLREDFAGKLPEGIPIFLYHCLDDEEVPFSHFDQYRGKLTRATFRALTSGGHQLNNKLAAVADDIKSV